MTTTEPGLRIVQLRVNNLMRLYDVDITPTGDLVVISGKNGQGKTSLLNSIWFALGGGRATTDTPKPIRDGAAAAAVTVDLGTMKVTRTWTELGTQLQVESKDGAVFRSPQKMLDDLIGHLAFDPLEFANLKDKDQLAALLDLVELPFDPAALEAERAAVFAERTAINRDLKRLEAQVAGMPRPAADVPKEEVQADEVPISSLVDEYRAAVDQVEAHDRQVLAYQQATDRVAAARQELERLEAELAALPTPSAGDDLPDVDACRAKIDDAEEHNKAVRLAAEETNAQVRAAAEYRHFEQVLDQTREAALELTARLTATDKRKADALAAATMPIAGLSFDADGITYQDVPFKQASGAEQLRVSLAIAMALNPKLRVIRITDGSLLDADNMRLIEEMAGDKGFQVWIEVVGDDTAAGIVIEDGQVRKNQ